MASRTHRLRKLIELQGFTDLSDQALWDLNYWLRLSPFVCGVWTAVGVSLESPVILWALVPFAALGTILPNHPFDAIYNLGVRHLLGTPLIPRYHAPRRVACGLVTLWVLAMGWSFQAGFKRIGWGLAGVILTIQAVQMLTGFCVPSFVYRRVAALPCGRFPPESRSTVVRG